MNSAHPTATSVDDIGEEVRGAAIARLHHLFITGDLSLEHLSGSLGAVLAASSRGELADAMSGLPPLVRVTPASHTLAKPLVLRAPDSDLHLAPGWQLAANTTICTGSGSARLDLTLASWDALDINLRLETWGSLEVLVPEGADVRITGGTASIRMESLSTPFPGGPLLHVSTGGPSGLVRIRHP